MIRLFKFLIVISAAGLAGSMVLTSCGKKSHSHAPFCPYGQALVYDDAGYNCRYVQQNMYGNFPYGNGYPYGTPSANPGTATVLMAPIMQCPNGQVLVNWRGSWYCYMSETIYPSGGDSPTGVVAPPGKGNEYCTSAGMYPGYAGQQYPGSPYSPYGQNYGMYNPSTYLGCSPGFQCQLTAGASPVPSASPTAYPMGSPNAGGFGQAGSCVYTGYRPY